MGQAAKRGAMVEDAMSPYIYRNTQNTTTILKH